MMRGMELEPGTLVDGWQIMGAVRAGGFGAVHRAEQHGKSFALKVALHREESGDTGRTHARALREVSVLLRMDHPHIIKARGFGYLPDGRVYCVQEYVDGWTLGEWLERTHPTFREIAGVFAKIAGAVAYMHEGGVLHRDLKPSNVMVRKNGEPVIIDLGCATYENAEELTTTPLPPGTERYRAPEARAFLRTQGRKPGARYSFKVADELYAVGVMLYELLTDPLPTKDPLEHPKPRGPRLVDPWANLCAPRDVNPRVPEALNALVEDLLARDPELRPENFHALQRRLAELAGHQEPDYAQQVHPPSLQRQPVPGVGEQQAGLAAPGPQGRQKVLAWLGEQATWLYGRLRPRALGGRGAASRQHWRKSLVLAGMLATVALTAAAAAWLARGASPAPGWSPVPRGAITPAVPGSGPALPPGKSSPEPPLAPAPARDSATPATAPKEGSTVKPQPSDALKSPRPSGAPKAASTPAEPGTPAWCKAVPLFVALAHAGCASVPLKAEPFECPPGAIEAMEKKLGWVLDNRRAGRMNVTIDERGPYRGYHSFTPGAPVTGVVPDQEKGQTWAPPRTLFYGRIYVTEKTARFPLGEVRAIYDHVEIPGVGKFPVCVVSGLNPIVEMKDGTAKARSTVFAYPERSWEPHLED